MEVFGLQKKHPFARRLAVVMETGHVIHGRYKLKGRDESLKLPEIDLSSELHRFTFAARPPAPRSFLFNIRQL